MNPKLTLHVGNLPFSATEEELRSLFSPHAPVLSVSLVADRETGRPRGFGFVTLDATDAQPVLDAVGTPSLGGRPLRISVAQERQRIGGGPFRR